MPTPTEAPSHLDEAPDERGVAARRYADQRRAFHGHVGGFATGMFIMLAVNLVTNISAGTAGEWNAWWTVWALLGWSIGIAVHGFVVWLNRPSFAPSTAEEIDALQGRRARRDDSGEK
ncbi:MAG: 2TM domain-containing protein [Actinomycetota bacterium]